MKYSIVTELELASNIVVLTDLYCPCPVFTEYFKHKQQFTGFLGCTNAPGAAAPYWYLHL